MKILFAIKSLNVVGGGAERVLADVATGLCRRGHEIVILTFDYPGESFYPLDSTIVRLDMAFNSPGTPISAIDFLRAIPRLRHAVRAQKADVIVPFMHSTAIPVTFATLGTRQRIVFSEHIDYRHYENFPKQYALLKLFRRAWHGSTVPSQTALDSYPEADQRHMQVIPNPLNMDDWRIGRESKPAERPILLAVGRLMEQKDHVTLLEAFSRVAGQFPNWTLRILGDGPMRSKLEAQVATFGLDGQVEMLGTVRNVALEYATARFVVLPSRYESFGMVAAEASASTRAVLCFDDCAGVTELVRNNQNGILVHGATSNAARIESLTEGLRLLMGDADLCSRLGGAGAEAVAHLELRPVLDIWEATLSEFLGISTPSPVQCRD